MAITCSRATGRNRGIFICFLIQITAYTDRRRKFRRSDAEVFLTRLEGMPEPARDASADRSGRILRIAAEQKVNGVIRNYKIRIGMALFRPKTVIMGNRVPVALLFVIVFRVQYKKRLDRIKGIFFEIWCFHILSLPFPQKKGLSGNR